MGQLAAGSSEFVHQGSRKETWRLADPELYLGPALAVQFATKMVILRSGKPAVEVAPVGLQHGASVLDSPTPLSTAGSSSGTDRSRCIRPQTAEKSPRGKCPSTCLGLRPPTIAAVMPAYEVSMQSQRRPQQRHAGTAIFLSKSAIARFRVRCGSW